MTAPMLTVLVLAVLWLIVVVPMIVRRHDDRAHERSVEQFGRSMRALTRRHVALSRPAVSRRADVDDTRQAVGRVAGPRTLPRMSEPRPELFVPGARAAALAPSMRRPVPAAEEALMYPVDRTEMSPARLAMMARRRRSLAILGLGSAVTLVLAVVLGGVLWVPALLFLAGLGGYVYFLRSQVVRDRERREARQVRASARGPVSYDATDDPEPNVTDSTVRIDDDALALHDHDTIDLTGLYAEETFAQEGAQRRAS
jgi:hypothetical protein